MYEDWIKYEFDRLPTVYDNLGAIRYKLFMKKDSKDRYWIISYSIKQPAFKYIGCIKKEYNSIIESDDINKISALLIDSNAYISYGDDEEIAKVFEVFTSWSRNPNGKDRLSGDSVRFLDIEDYLSKYDVDEDIIETIRDSLAIFCK